MLGCYLRNLSHLGRSRFRGSCAQWSRLFGFHLSRGALCTFLELRLRSIILYVACFFSSAPSEHTVRSSSRDLSVALACVGQSRLIRTLQSALTQIGYIVSRSCGCSCVYPLRACRRSCAAFVYCPGVLCLAPCACVMWCTHVSSLVFLAPSFANSEHSRPKQAVNIWWGGP